LRSLRHAGGCLIRRLRADGEPFSDFDVKAIDERKEEAGPRMHWQLPHWRQS
jgi:hypothetical protein